MITLSPIKQSRKNIWNNDETIYFENIVIISDGYPWAIAHIDTFSGVETRDIYKRLNAGEVVTVSLSIVKDDTSEKDKAEVERVNRAFLAGMPNA